MPLKHLPGGTVTLIRRLPHPLRPLATPSQVLITLRHLPHGKAPVGRVASGLIYIQTVWSNFQKCSQLILNARSHLLFIPLIRFSAQVRNVPLKFYVMVILAELESLMGIILYYISPSSFKVTMSPKPQCSKIDSIIVLRPSGFWRIFRRIIHDDGFLWK